MDYTKEKRDGMCGACVCTQEFRRKRRRLRDSSLRVDSEPDSVFLFLSVMENLLPGQKYGKYIRLFAGMVLILLAVEPFTSGFDLEEVLARSYEDLMVRGEAEELKKEQLGVSEQKRLGQIFSQYEEAVGRDVRELAQSLGVSLSDCSVRIEDDESSPEFGTVQEIGQFFLRSPHRQNRRKLSNKIQEYYGLEGAVCGN